VGYKPAVVLVIGIKQLNGIHLVPIPGTQAQAGGVGVGILIIAHIPEKCAAVARNSSTLKEPRQADRSGWSRLIIAHLPINTWIVKRIKKKDANGGYYAKIKWVSPWSSFFCGENVGGFWFIGNHRGAKLMEGFGWASPAKSIYIFPLQGNSHWPWKVYEGLDESCCCRKGLPALRGENYRKRGFLPKMRSFAEGRPGTMYQLR
jgi:hypothetical protein